MGFNRIAATGAAALLAMLPPIAWSGESRPARVPNRVNAPPGGVELVGGVFRQSMDWNVTYLLENSNLDNMLRVFRAGAGQKNVPGRAVGWEAIFPAHAPQFLMGAGNTLRWREEPELRKKLDEVVAGLMACRNAEGGLVVPYGRQFGLKEDALGYTLELLALGLEAAHKAGNRDAVEVLGAMARHYRKLVASETAKNPDWCFRYNQNHFGVTPCMLAYFSPAGVPEDIGAAKKHVHATWQAMLLARDLKGICEMPISHSHSAIGYALIGWLDLYRATGDRRMLDAVLAARDMMRENWQHVGGSLAICEHRKYPPKCYPITSKGHTGELCSQVMWILLHHRLHLLFPDQEPCIDQIEKSIYNVGLAGQEPAGKGMYYHLLLEGTKKDGGKPYAPNVPTPAHTCCEGMGTWLYGNLPQFVYSMAPDGVYVNLFAASKISTRVGDRPFALSMQTEFPYTGEVSLTIIKGAKANLRVRVPSWVTGDVAIRVNGKETAAGNPGSFVSLERDWADGDAIAFTLPMSLKLTKYAGSEDAIAGHDRYALEYGPILLAAKGPLGKPVPALIAQDPAALVLRLAPVVGNPLHVAIPDSSHTYVPYWQLRGDEQFTCYPVIELPR
jgi:DUF1680 family protein